MYVETELLNFLPDLPSLTQDNEKQTVLKKKTIKQSYTQAKKGIDLVTGLAPLPISFCYSLNLKLHKNMYTV